MKAVYTRQSLDKKDSISIETQIDECISRAGNATYKIYSDKGYSGKDTKRPAFKEMMEDIKSGVIDQVIVYKLDRISRNVVDFVQMHETFTKYGASFVSCKEGFDSSNQLGRLLMMMLISFAQFERESIQLRVRDSYYSRGSKGFYMGGALPYGFNKEKTVIDGINTSQLITNEEEAKIIMELYERYALTDISLGKLSKDLNQRGIKSSSGVSWDSGKISRMLRNPLYVRADADIYIYYQYKKCNITNPMDDYIGTNGVYIYGKREANERKYTNVEDHYVTLAPHEGLIDSDIWLKVQYKLDSNTQIRNSGTGKHTYLTGLLKCGKCGYAVCVTSGYRRSRYLTCRGRSNLKVCDGIGRSIKVNEVESVVKTQLTERVKELRGITTEDAPNKSKTEVNSLKIKLAKVNEQINNLIEGLANGNTKLLSYLNAKISELDDEKAEIEAAILQKSLEHRKTTDTDAILDKIERWDELDFEDQRDTAKAMIDKVFVKADEIGIQWKF